MPIRARPWHAAPGPNLLGLVLGALPQPIGAMGVRHALPSPAQLPKGITHSSELRIAQTWRRSKDHSKSFPTISGTTPKSS
uniref:Secreted protein n=1 Tax=Solanum tuberosum TaxID=4113 RepID=M1DKZ3_SOLTU